jgi:hypothetical protein
MNSGILVEVVRKDKEGAMSRYNAKFNDEVSNKFP